MKQIKDLTDIKNFFVQNKILVGFSFGILVILFCWLFLFLFPQLRTIAKTSREIKTLSRRAKDLNLKKIDNNFLTKKNVALKEEIDFYKNSVLNKEEVTSLLGYLSQSAKKTDVRIMGIEPLQREEKEGDYLPLFIKINLGGKFHQLVDFVSYLRGCNKFIDIEKFKVISSGGKEEARFILKSLISAQEVVPRQRPTGEIFCLRNIPSISKSTPFSVKTTKVSSSFQDVSSLSDIHLQGIVHEQENPLAVINGCVVQEGEQLGEFMLEAIKEQEILLNKGNESFAIKLK